MIKTINQKIYYYLLPFLLGGVTSFSLPPYNFILINFLTFPILLSILIEIQKKNDSLWLNFNIGWLFGIGYFLSNIYLGDIAINYEIINKRSKNSNFFIEFDKMWIHGCLHLLGHNHKKKKDFIKMKKLENLILNYFYK